MPDARQSSRQAAACATTGAGVHRGSRAIRHMVEFAPATGGLALWAGHADLKPGGSIDPGGLLSTDGSTLFYGEGFEKLPLDEQAGLVACGVLHVALGHARRFRDLQASDADADLSLFALCADAIVNSSLAQVGWLRLPQDATGIDALLSATLGVRQDVESALAEWHVERLYRAIDDRRPRPSGRRGGADGGSGSGTGGGTTLDGPRAARARRLRRAGGVGLCPQPPAGQVTAPERLADEAHSWQQRVRRAHAEDGEFSMLRALASDLDRTRTPWPRLLRCLLARALVATPSLSWSRPSRNWLANQGRAGRAGRMPWEPGWLSNRPAPRLAVIVDVSGSIDPVLLQRFARELEGIARRSAAGLVLVVGDDRVRSVTMFPPGQVRLEELACEGGGGTDFSPLLQAAASHRPDIIVVLTDLEGPAAYRPGCPVLWAVPGSRRDATAPYGRVVVLD